MALMSYCSNLQTLQSMNPEMSAFQHREAEPEGDLLTFCDTLDFPNNALEPSFDPNLFIYPESYTNLLPYFAPLDPLNSLSPETFSHEDFDSYLHPKRQKCYEDPYCLEFLPSGFNGFVRNLCLVPEFSPPELLVSPPEYQIPAVDYAGNVQSARKTSDGCVTVQSIAARERRRKITEKTQELGKLIPGGSKMNTAEMLQAAFKYVKYLQAQVGILELMGSIQEMKEAASAEELSSLLASQAVQEKLYAEEKCLVLKGALKIFAKHHDFHPNSSISTDINLLIHSQP